MANDKGSCRGLEKIDMICVKITEIKKRIVKNVYRIDSVNSVDETRLEFIDSWGQGILW